MQDYLKPVETFIKNLEFWGFEFHLSATGALTVGMPNRFNMSPVVEAEIRKRATLIERVLENREPAYSNTVDSE